jgi:hypothetical protein
MPRNTTDAIPAVTDPSCSRLRASVNFLAHVDETLS